MVYVCALSQCGTKWREKNTRKIYYVNVLILFIDAHLCLVLTTEQRSLVYMLTCFTHRPLKFPLYIYITTSNPLGYLKLVVFAEITLKSDVMTSSLVKIPFAKRLQGM